MPTASAVSQGRRGDASATSNATPSMANAVMPASFHVGRESMYAIAIPAAIDAASASLSMVLGRAFIPSV